jgi:hypothetical protein
VTTTPVLFYVGHRTKEILENRWGEDLAGGLMSDGYLVYRDSLKRLRCGAHRLRQARGLEENLDAEARRFGSEDPRPVQDPEGGGLPRPRRAGRRPHFRLSKSTE